MTNERKNPGEDQLVADTYKELARERAPDHLNAKVLRLADDGRRTRYSKARAWIRPVAWAATIGLSLAIVLELTRLPQIEPEVPGVSAPGELSVPDDRTRGGDASAAKQSGPPVSAPIADHVEDEPGRPATPTVERPDQESMDQFAPRDMDILSEAENMARAQAGPDQPPFTVTTELKVDAAEADDAPIEEHVAAESMVETAAARSLTAVVQRQERSRDPSCPAKVRESAESWYACIKELRANDLADLADSEYDEFQRIFPDFVDPEADK